MPRFDIVGDLWGTLDVALCVPLHNVGYGGALIQSHVPMPEGSVHRVHLTVEGREFSTSAQVRHVRAAVGADGEPRFLIGVEFVEADPVLLSRLTELAAPPDMRPAEV